MLLTNPIAQACPDGIIVVEDSGRICDLNLAAETLFGWPRPLLIGKMIDCLFPDETSRTDVFSIKTPPVYTGCPDLKQGWRPVEARRLDRVPLWLESHAAQYTSDGMTLSAIFFRARQGTQGAAIRVAPAMGKERRTTAHDGALLALAAEHASDSMIISDAAGFTIWVNAATERLTGYKSGEMIGRKPGHILQGPKTDQNVVVQISRAVEAGFALRCDILNYRKSGQPYWAELTLSPIAGPDGRVRNFVGVSRDVSLVRQGTQAVDEARRAAERAEQRLMTAIDEMSEGFVIYDENDRLVMTNEAYRRLRVEDADILVPGISFEDIVRISVERGHYDTLGQAPEAWIADQVASRRASERSETMVRFSDGRWMLRRERRTPHGEMVGIRSDITAFKQHEEMLERAREKAEAADQAKTEFIANVSHELRTPINSIMGFNELLLASGLKPKQRKCAEIIKASSEHLLHLVNNVLDLSKIVSKSMELEPQVFDLRAFLRETVLSLKPLADAKNLTLSLRIKLPKSCAVCGDRGRIAQILINLIGNAIKFTAQGTVEVGVSASNGGYRFKIADTGAGIAEDKLDTIFQRFARIKSVSCADQGAGLGLAITKSLVELMNGTISVTSTPGHGSVFTVWVPLNAPAKRVVPSPAPSQDMDHEGECGQIAKIYDVLVAEDHPFSQILIREILKSIGCRITLAENGQQLLDTLNVADFDLIILDNQMPLVTGEEAIERIRQRTDWKMRLPIIALTASALPETERRYADLGVDAFITKPLSVETVIKSVKRHASAGRRLRETAR